MSEKKYPFPKKTGTLQKHNFKNKLDIFLFLFWARKGIYKRLKSRNNYNLEDCLLEIAELKEENEQLRNLVDWADSHFENDDDTDVIFKWNAYAEKLGANLEEILNKGFDSDE